MKLIRYGQQGQEKTGVLIDGKRYDTAALGQDYNEQFFETGGLEKLSAFIKENEGKLSEVNETERWGSPVARPSKIICIGLNYAKHAQETGAAIPKEPIVFFKATTALCGPYDNVVIPKNSVKTDWEVELAVVIGKRCSYVEKEVALDYVAGYALINDYSEREFQIERGGQWVKGKGCDTFAPLGPFMATKEDIKDPNNLNLWLSLNGKRLQDSSTSDFIFNVQYVVSYLSQFMTLLPGDVISTGTPAGVGLGMKPAPWYLKPGDIVELGIEGLGQSRQTAVAYEKN
ncbi:MAG TPA: fumarylacetoacetate hydrolase family protein [Arachidicoccus sp.]|nr:fumarylacetoacetate hydrolase family protein [Arachidicoccus sp.]